MPLKQYLITRIFLMNVSCGHCLILKSTHELFEEFILDCFKTRCNIT